jgi:hypothetical protein
VKKVLSIYGNVTGISERDDCYGSALIIKIEMNNDIDLRAIKNPKESPFS